MSRMFTVGQVIVDRIISILPQRLDPIDTDWVDHLYCELRSPKMTVRPGLPCRKYSVGIENIVRGSSAMD